MNQIKDFTLWRHFQQFQATNQLYLRIASKEIRNPSFRLFQSSKHLFGRDYPLRNLYSQQQKQNQNTPLAFVNSFLHSSTSKENCFRNVHFSLSFPFPPHTPVVRYCVRMCTREIFLRLSLIRKTIHRLFHTWRFIFCFRKFKSSAYSHVERRHTRVWSLSLSHSMKSRILLLFIRVRPRPRSTTKRLRSGYGWRLNLNYYSNTHTYSLDSNNNEIHWMTILQ